MTHNPTATIAPAAAELDGPELLAGAIEAAGIPARRFAVEVLDVNERTVRRWLASDRPLDPTVAKVCRLILDDPTIATRMRTPVAAP